MGKASALLGMPLMPWQQDVVDTALETLDGPGSRWAFPMVGVTVPRQAGKTTMVQAVISHRGAMLEDGRLWVTAQNRDKARARWLDMSGKLVKRLPRSFSRNIGNSHEVLRWLRTGSELRPFAPNAESMHSESPDLVAPDEIWAFDAVTAALIQQAYLPGMITKNAQEFLTSTQGTDESEWLNEVTDDGRAAVEAGVTSGTYFYEQSVPRWVDELTLEAASEQDGTPVEQLDDERLLDVICAHHPAFGHTITREALAFHLARFSRDRVGFIRGYGNLRLGSAKPRVLPVATVEQSRTDLELPAAFGVSVVTDNDGQHVRIVAAGRHVSGRAVVEVVRAGDGWTVQTEAGLVVSPIEYVRQLVAAGGVTGVAVPTSGTGRDLGEHLIAALDETDVPVMLVGPADYSAACARFKTGLEQLTVLHRGQRSLTDAMGWTGRRKVAGGLGWLATSPDKPVTALDAATLALWAADHPGEQLGEFRIY